MKETEQERINAKESLGILVVKPNKIGVSRVNEWWAVVSLETITKLLKDFDAEGLQSSRD